MKITCMRGYPGSGKSTAAKELAEDTGAVIVSRDNLRRQMFGKFHGVDEHAVTIAEGEAVSAALDAGKDVIVDAMHLNPKYLRKWANVARRRGADFDVYDVLTEVDECIIQDSDIDRLRIGKSVGHQVIRDLAARWPQSGWPVVDVKPQPPPEAKRDSAMFDEARRIIEDAPTHFVAAEAALAASDFRYPDGRMVFGEVMVTHALLALVEQLREGLSDG